MAAIVLQPNASLRVSIYCRQQNQVSCNVRGYRFDALAPVTVQSGPVCDAFANQFSTPYLNLLGNLADFFGVQVLFNANSTNPQIDNSSFGPADGLGGPVPLPGQTCGLISLSTGFTGRSNRGRLYVPFPPASHNGPSGVPDQDYIGFLGELRDKLLEGVTGGGATFVPYLLGQQNEATVAITGGRVRTVWATQRRRGAFGAPNSNPF